MSRPPELPKKHSTAKTERKKRLRMRTNETFLFQTPAAAPRRLSVTAANECTSNFPPHACVNIHERRRPDAHKQTSVAPPPNNSDYKNWPTGATKLFFFFYSFFLFQLISKCQNEAPGQHEGTKCCSLKPGQTRNLKLPPQFVKMAPQKSMRITLGEKLRRVAGHFHYHATILAVWEAAVILSIDQMAASDQADPWSWFWAMSEEAGRRTITSLQRSEQTHVARCGIIKGLSL